MWHKRLDNDWDGNNNDECIVANNADLLPALCRGKSDLISGILYLAAARILDNSDRVEIDSPTVIFLAYFRHFDSIIFNTCFRISLYRWELFFVLNHVYLNIYLINIILISKFQNFDFREVKFFYLFLSISQKRDDYWRHVFFDIASLINSDTSHMLSLLFFFF